MLDDVSWNCSMSPERGAQSPYRPKRPVLKLTSTVSDMSSKADACSMPFISIVTFPPTLLPKVTALGSSAFFHALSYSL